MRSHMCWHLLHEFSRKGTIKLLDLRVKEQSRMRDASDVVEIYPYAPCRYCSSSWYICLSRFIDRRISFLMTGCTLAMYVLIFSMTERPSGVL